ncbi:FUSC family protein [Hufsiella ginkgonis]|uniref:FUSC family protein n=1 Tax=Hufsiella ginkgonis TaxID=2695274 RepID=A0A7K1XV60_9SPHI|nr:FUSC family protein [Hufsiella ginkgonis]MXV14895.1 FUSC family protein [Hufsiella ginkgonis]
MKQTEPAELSEQELSGKRKKTKSASITNAVFTGVMIGIVIYSIIKNGWGFFILVPLFFIYKAFKNSKNDKELEKK